MGDIGCFDEKVVSEDARSQLNKGHKRPYNWAFIIGELRLEAAEGCDVLSVEAFLLRGGV